MNICLPLTSTNNLLHNKSLSVRAVPGFQGFRLIAALVLREVVCWGALFAGRAEHFCCDFLGLRVWGSGPEGSCFHSRLSGTQTLLWRFYPTWHGAAAAATHRLIQSHGASFRLLWHCRCWLLSFAAFAVWDPEKSPVNSSRVSGHFRGLKVGKVALVRVTRWFFFKVFSLHVQILLNPSGFHSSLYFVCVCTAFFSSCRLAFIECCLASKSLSY